MRGGENHYILEHLNAKFMEEVEIRADLVKTPYPFPAIKRGSGLVKGEMYNVSDEAIVRLDFFEGNPVFYERRSTYTVDGITVEAYWGTGVIGEPVGLCGHNEKEGLSSQMETGKISSVEGRVA